MGNDLNFLNLINTINDIDKTFVLQAKRAVNINLTLRNWFIGAYIQEYELNGSDRAEYGDKLLNNIAKKLENLSNCNRRQLYEYIQFYKTYPQIVGTVSAQFKDRLPDTILKDIEKVPTLSAQSKIPAETIISKLSYSMFKLLISIEDDTKRAFYEIEAINNNWSVRELKRQINSLYYERSGLSKNKEKLSELANIDIEKEAIEINIKDPYVFEFLGLKAKEVMSESHLEDELLNNLQEFLLELGHGFCFEARQKRILIGDKHYFLDLVFYHRILKCHVLVELKLEGFSHENIGQLNTYCSWYKENVMIEGDNPPVGILLCTEKDHTLVKYALAGMDDNLFVSKYQLELPKKEEMERFIEEKLKEAGEV
jgi:predicted nuclease of restriction endonuclease-like (RecB) superfamily